MEGLIRLVNTLLHPKPRFAVGDRARFDPGEQAGELPHDRGGYYPGYVGRVTQVRRNIRGAWVVHLDDKPSGFKERFFQKVQSEENVST